MKNFIEDSSDSIMLNSMFNVFVAEKLDPVGQEDDDIDNDGDSDKSDAYLRKRRKTVGDAIAADKAKKVKKEEIELSLRGKVGALTEKKLYRSEKSTTSDEKELTIEEKPVKNKVTINPDVAEGVVNEASGVASSQRRPSPEEDKNDPGYKMSSYDRQVKRFGIRQPSEVPDAPRYGQQRSPKTTTKTKAASKDATKAAPSASITGNKASNFMNPGASKAFDDSKSSTAKKTITTKSDEGPKSSNLTTNDPKKSVNMDILKYLKSMQKEQTTDYRASMAADAAAARKATRARAEKNMKKLETSGGAIKGIQSLRKKAGVDYENDPNMVNTAPGIYRSKQAIEADKPLQQRLSELPSNKKRAQVDAARTKKMMAAPIPTSTPKTPTKTPKITEEASDAMKDRRMERGGVDGNNRYDRPTKRSDDDKKRKGKTVLQKETEKKYGKMSAIEIVKAQIRAKHGKGAVKE